MRQPRCAFLHPRALLLAGWILIFAVLVLLVALVSLNDRQQSIEQVDREASRITDAVAHAIRISHGKADMLLDDIAEDFPPIANQTSARQVFGAKLAATTVRHKEIALAGVLDARGRLIGRLNQALADDPRASSRNNAAVAPGQTPATVVGSPIQDKATGQSVLPLFRELKDAEGRHLGMAIVAISIENLEGEFIKLRRDGDSRILLVDAAGTVLARHPKDTGPVQVNAHTRLSGLADYIDRHPSGQIEAVSPFDGVMRRYTFRHVEASTLRVVFGETTEDRLSDWRHRTRWRVVLLSLVLVMLSATALYIDKLIRQSVRHRLELEESAAKASGLEFALHRHAMLTRTDTSDIIIGVNQSFCERSGYSREELLGQNHRIINSGTHSAEFFRDLHKTINAGKVWIGDICNRTKNKEIFWARTTIVPLRNAAGTVTQYIVLRTDISELKFMQRQIQVANETLAASFDLLYATINSSSSGIVTTSMDGTVILMNTAAEAMLGYKQYEAENELSMLEVHDAVQIAQALVEANIDPDLTPEDQYGIVVRIITEHPEQEWSLITKRGDSLPVRIMVSPMYGRNGTMQGYVTSFNDLTRFKEIEAMKSDFVSMVSHELRTPLTSIKGALTLLDKMSGQRLAENQKKLLDIATANCESLVQIVSDILDFEKVSRNEMSYQMAPQDAVALLEKAVAITRPYANQFNVGYVVTHGESKLPLLGDQQRLVQVLVNLLSNAAKFSHPGTDVSVSTRRTGADVEFLVADRGIGIPQACYSRIFQRFSQVDHGSRPTKIKGTGLGLSIAKMMVEAHGGSIGFTSEESVGTTFFVRLPLA